MRRVVFRDFRVVDADGDFYGSVVVENGIIGEVTSDSNNGAAAGLTVDGREFGDSAVLMPAFVDLHAHFREPGFSEKETLESGSLAAAAGGFTTVVCMANTKPVIDTAAKARALKIRSNAIGLVDLYPVLSLTKNMEGRELSGIKDSLPADDGGFYLPLMLSEDGKDVADDELFFSAMGEAKRLGIPVSCHCDLGGEDDAVRRAVELGKKAGCHIHIAHVSTKEAVNIIRKAKKNDNGSNGFFLTCEATPHHIGASEADAFRMGDESFGRVNPPLRSEDDRQAIIAALNDGTIDAIATDHAPHRDADKAAGAPGFSGLETAFAVCVSNLATNQYEQRYNSGNANIVPSLRRLSALMSANPARILGLRDRGHIKKGLRADLVIADTQAREKIDPGKYKSRGLCNPFVGSVLQGTILMTLNAGKIVFGGY